MGRLEVVMKAEDYIYKRAVILGVDGAGAFFKDADVPNIDRIFKDGAKSFSVLTAIPTISAQCWGAMLIGVDPEYHHLTNGIVSEIPYDTNSRFPTLFRKVRRAYKDAELASFCNWTPINYGIVENNLGVYEDNGGDDVLTDKICAYLEKHDPKLLFVQFDDVDEAGHSKSYGSARHLDQIHITDGYIGRIFDAYEKRGMIEDTLFIVTADHGGLLGGYSHGGVTDEEKYVFYAVKGKTVKSGDIPDMRITDNAAIVLHALGVERPEQWTARIPDGVFENIENQTRPVMTFDYSNGGRTHANVPTPENKITEILDKAKIYTYLPFDGNSDNACGKVETETHGKIYYVDGYFGKSVRLDDGYVTLKNLELSNGNFSIAFWFRTGEIKTESVIFGNNDAMRYDGKGISLSFNRGGLKLVLNNAETRCDTMNWLPLDYRDGWVHATLCVDRNKNEATFWYDFKKLSTTALPEEMKTGDLDSASFNIGRDGTGKYPRGLSAEIDEFIITSEIISDAICEEMREYYQN